MRELDTGADFVSTRFGNDECIARSSSTSGPLTKDRRLTAGLVDLQVNGFAGVDFNDAGVNSDDVDRALNAMLACGVTTCLPTVITASPDKLYDRLRALDRAVAASKLGPWMVPGYHLEGPFLNPAAGYAGCHDYSEMAAPRTSLVQDLERDLLRPILYLTLAPERPGSDSLISWAVQHGKIVGIGHSAVHRRDLTSAVALGARISTHLGNGVPQTLHRSDNAIMLQLADDRLCASFIADGLHITPEALKVYIRAKGVERSILVTDAVSAARAAVGRYRLGDIALELDDTGAVRAANESFLAGSSLSMDRALRNIVTWRIVDFRGALRMACANPLALLEPALRAHGISLAAGQILWNDEIRPISVTLGPFAWRCA